MKRLRLSTRATAIVLAMLILLLAIVIAVNSPIPAIEQQYGDTSLHFTADRAWALFPGDCVTISWQTEGIESLYIEGRGEIGWGERTFCPQIDHTSARFEVRSPDGLHREFQLRLHFLPDLLVYLTGIVGTLGSVGMAAYFLLTKRMDKALNLPWLLVCLSALMVIGLFLRLNEPEPPRLEAADGQVKVAMWAEKASLIFPRECVDIGLSVVGAQVVRHEGEIVTLRDNAAQVLHCEYPGHTAMLEVKGVDGVERQYELPLRVLWGSLAHAPVFFYVNIVALVVAALVYLPMAINKARLAWLRREWSDIVAAVGLAAAVLIVYLPFGFESAGQWEEWLTKSYFERSPSELWRGEFATRPFAALPRTLATLVDSESFVGFHIVTCANIALLVILAYGVLRKIGLRKLYAYLIATFVLAFPVNDMLLGTRYTAGTSSVLWLMLACFCALDFLDSSRWRSLAGCALALLLNIGAYDAGLALLFVMPFVLWLRRGMISWRRINLALLFCLAVSLKASWVLWLYVTGRPGYASRTITALLSADPSTHSPKFDGFTDGLANIYFQTFLGGWLDAFESLAVNDWWLPTLGAVCCLSAAALYISRQHDETQEPAVRQILQGALVGFALIIPATGIMILLKGMPSATAILVGRVSNMMTYVPAAAAVAMFCLLLLLTAKLRDRHKRDLLIIAVTTALLLPSMSKLFVAHGALTDRAHAKAKVLYRVLAEAPHLEPNSILMVMTTLSERELAELGLIDLYGGNVFSSAISVLYPESNAPQGFFCYAPFSCARGIKGKFKWGAQERWHETVVLELRPDLTVELVDDPGARFHWGKSINYAPLQLIDSDAPLPPRARTMLATAWREANS
ncbi:MAG: hypothetical protein OXE46_16035 [Chloroflexi bacterium]|nr:hypothetical protein [Chloroflexota bacterium]